jgi:glycine/D-amino acid oxidase-like deaminating enzyme
MQRMDHAVTMTDFDALGCDVLVLGDGEPGRLAALAAEAAGATVVLLDERPSPEGAAVRRIRTGALGWGCVAWGAWHEDGALVVAASAGGERVVVRPRRLVIALRSFEVPVPVPGWTLPGVVGIDALPALDLAGRRVVLAGSGLELLQCASALVSAGVMVAGLVEAAARPASASLVEGLEVSWGTEILACEGEGRFAALLARGPEGERRIAADLCVLHRGRRAEMALARLLGAEVAGGDLILEADGRATLAHVFVVRDDAARAERGRLAGMMAAADLGFAAPDAMPLRRRIAGAEKADAAARAVYGVRPPLPIPDEAIACVCEGVTAGRVRAVGGSAVAAKRATRAGMGACGGRLCAAIVGQLCGERDALWDTPRAPVRPVPASAILRDTPDPHPPVWEAQILPPRGRADHDAPPLYCDVAVLGGGVVGISAALFLERAGRDVVLLDRAEPGQGASSANAGSLHVQLLPYTFSAGDPGPLATALRLGPESIALWRELAREANDDFGIRLRGGLVLARDGADLDLLERKSAFERSRGVEVEVIGPAEVARISPSLAPVAGAAWCAAEGQIDPLRGTAALLRLARLAGVRVEAGREPLELARKGAGWRIETARGTVRAGHVLNCAGTGAVGVARLAGVALAVRTEVHTVTATARAPDQSLPLVAVAGRHLSLKQNYGGQLLIGGGWPGALRPDGRATVLRSTMEGNLALAASVLPMLAGAEVVRCWSTPTVRLDRGPVISATPGLPGLWHGVVSNGYTLGPVVGRMLAEAVLGRATLAAEFAIG